MKKIGKILLVIFLVAVYCNIGYYGGKSFNDIKPQYQQSKKQEITDFQNFQIGAWNFWRPSAKLDSTRIVVYSIILWPGGLVVSSATWIVHGIVWLCVFLFSFIFLGGFFKLVGPLWSAIIISVVFICIMSAIFSPIVCPKKKKKKEDK